MDRRDVRIHLVTLTWADSFLLDSLNLERLELLRLVEHLTQIHDDTLMNLLSKMSPEDLNERDLQSWNLAMHEDAQQVEVNLDVGLGPHQSMKRRFGIWFRPEHWASSASCNA